MVVVATARAWSHYGARVDTPCSAVIKQDDTEGIRILAGRAQWISSPSP